jgi:hypothetical protein
VEHVEDHSDYEQPEVANIGPAELAARIEEAKKAEIEECIAELEEGHSVDECEAEEEAHP